MCVFRAGGGLLRRRNSSARTGATLSTIIHSYLGPGQACRLHARDSLLRRSFETRYLQHVKAGHDAIPGEKTRDKYGIKLFRSLFSFREN